MLSTEQWCYPQKIPSYPQEGRLRGVLMFFEAQYMGFVESCPLNIGGVDIFEGQLFVVVKMLTQRGDLAPNVFVSLYQIGDTFASV